MDGAVLGSADFSNTEAVNISWRGVDMRRAILVGANLKGGVIDCDTKLPREFSIEGSGLIPEKAVCGTKRQNRIFSNLAWPYFLRLQDFALQGADFSGGEFANAEFQNAELRGADFSRTKGDAAFSGADLTDASFRDASIRPRFAAFKDYRGETYGDARLDGADFSGARLGADRFLSGEALSIRFDLDLSTAIFDRAHFSCRAGFHRRQIGELAEFEADPKMRQGGAKDRGAILERWAKEAHAYLEAEGALVRFIAGKWPTATFDPECVGYSAAADERLVKKEAI